MKKSLLALLLAASVPAFAGLEKVAIVQLADTAEQTAAITQLSNLLGNPMLGAFAGAAVTENALTKTFGPMRTGKGDSVVFALYADADRLAELVKEKSPEGGLKGVSYTVTYPVTGTKKKFLQGHPGAVETNGVIRVKKNEYVAFSADGQWMTRGESAALARAALDEAKAARRPMNGDLVRAAGNGKGAVAICRLIDAARLQLTNVQERAQFDLIFNGTARVLLEGVSGVTLAVKVAPSGLEVRSGVDYVAGGLKSALGKTSLGKDPLAFAGPDVVSARHIAAGGTLGNSRLGYDEQIRCVIRMLKDVGLDTEKFLDVAVKGDDIRMTFDTKALFNYMSVAMTNEFAQLAANPSNALEKVQKMQETLKQLGDSATGELSTHPLRCSCAFKGYKGPASVGERFAATLPEVAGKDVFDVSFFSLYSIIRTVLPEVLTMLPDEATQALFKSVIDQLPAEGKGGMASAFWRVKDGFRGIYRISADEFKGIGGLVNAAMTGMAMCQGAGENDEDGDEDDGDDEEDDADDED